VNDEAAKSTSENADTGKKPPWKLTPGEGRLLAGVAGFVGVVAALVPFLTTNGESIIVAVASAFGVTVLGTILLLAAARALRQKKRELHIRFIQAICVLAGTATIGGAAGYVLYPLIGQPDKSPIASGKPPTPTSGISQNSPTPTASSTGSPGPSPTATLPVPTHIRVSPNLTLDIGNFCSWRLGSHPVPLKSISPLRIRVDGRCNYPTDPSPQTDGPSGVYSSADQTSENAVARVNDGTVVRLTCFTHGQAVSDSKGNRTDIWLGIRLRSGMDGLIPDVNAGYYSSNELKELGVHHCTQHFT
jgi:hypothetical protein